MYEKVVADSQGYMEYIKKLQEESELTFQRYIKLRKLCKASKVKLEEEDDPTEQSISMTIRDFMAKEVVSQFNKMMIPAFECKVRQRIAECEANVVKKLGKISEVKFLVEKARKRRQSKT
jgi:hypothetical protein